VVIADFGLAVRLLSEDERIVELCGTPGYVAPEVLSGEGYGKVGCAALLKRFDTHTHTQTHSILWVYGAEHSGVRACCCPLLARRCLRC
jgi:serine/threonine protein kinase